MVRVIHCGADTACDLGNATYEYIAGTSRADMVNKGHVSVRPYLEECEGYLTVCVCVQGFKGFFRDRDKEKHLSTISAATHLTACVLLLFTDTGGLTEHGFQSDQTGDKVVEVDRQVVLGVAQDDELEQVVGQLETCVHEGNTKAFLMAQMNNEMP